MSFFCFIAFSFVESFIRYPISSQNRHDPSCRGKLSEDDCLLFWGACSGAFHCTRIDTHTGERTRASGLAGTDWTKRTAIHVFCFCGVSSFSWSFSFMHFERALVIMSQALLHRTVSARDIMFILPPCPILNYSISHRGCNLKATTARTTLVLKYE